MKKSGHAVAAWREKEQLDGSVVDVGVIILRTTGCRHFHNGGCSMCGYNIDSDPDATAESMTKAFDNAVRDIGEVRMLKVYTSGSFLDECEVPDEAAKRILHYCKDRSIRLLLESRPEFVSRQRLDALVDAHDDIEVALGLESSSDKILRYSINKGFTVKDYENAARLLAEYTLSLRTYVLLKPPFVTESESIADSVATMKFAAGMSQTISLNPVNVQKGTMVERLWKNWEYRPPWLWSVLETVRGALGTGRKILCEPTGGGKARGAHNCGDCDDVILQSFRSFSLSQDPSKLGSPDCECREIWEAILDTEELVVGGTVDLQRHFRRGG